MRTGTCTLVVIAVLLGVVPPSPVGFSTPSPNHAARLAPAHAPVFERPSAPPSRSAFPDRIAVPLNLTYTGSEMGGPGASPGSPPISDVPAEPAPATPPTTPVIVVVASNASGCCVTDLFSAPAGPWEAIVLTYIGQAGPGVFDSSYRAFVDGVQVLFGTTPEYGEWVVHKDLTEYAALFRGTVNFTFVLAAAPSGAPFTATLHLLFYPVPPGATSPPEPDVIVPLWSGVFVKPGVPQISVNATLPANVTNVTLELFVYAFRVDEFWYLSGPTSSSYRELFIASDSKPIATVLPFPYINTGGIDLWLWRPISGVFTLDDRPYRTNLTPALGLLEGSHTYTANVSGWNLSSAWLVGGSLQAYTRPANSPAHPSSYVFPRPTSLVRTDHVTYYDQSVFLNYSYSSAVNDSGIAANASVNVSERFVSTLVISHPSSATVLVNLSGDEETTEVYAWGTPNRTVWSREVRDFPLGMRINSTFVETGSTGGGYPIYGNFSDALSGVVQQWSEQYGTVVSGTPSAPPVAAMWGPAQAQANEEIPGATGSYGGYEELTSPSSGVILKENFTNSQTAKTFSSAFTAGPLQWSFSHLLSGELFPKSNPNNAETILVNATGETSAVSVAANRTLLDVGESVSFVATAESVAGGYHYLWRGLPPGCAAVDAARIDCQVTSPGSYSVLATETDTAGGSSTSEPVPIVVVPDPTVSLSSNRSGTDVGGHLGFGASIVGGAGPFACRWSLNGAPSGSVTSCVPPFDIQAQIAGTVSVAVSVTDATGWIVAAEALVVPVAEDPGVSLTPNSPIGSIALGGSIEFSAVASGGTPPFRYSWLADGVPLPGFEGPTIVYAPNTSGSHSITVQVLDAAGWSASNVSAPFQVAPSSSGSSTGMIGGLPVWLVLAVVAGAVVVVLEAFVLLRNRKRPPKRTLETHPRPDRGPGSARSPIRTPTTREPPGMAHRPSRPQP